MPLKAVTWLLPLLFVVATINVYARTEPFTITTDKRVFHVSVDYEVQEAYVGNRSFKLNVSITTSGTGENLVLEACNPPEGAKLETRLERRDVTHYRCVLDIKDEAEPRLHQIDFTFKYSGLSIRESLDVPIGVHTNKSAKGNEWITVKSEVNPIELHAGGRSELPFTIQNNFPDYTAIITKVNISANRTGLLSNVDTSSVDPPNNTIGRLQILRAMAKFDVAEMSWRDVFIGFPEKEYLSVAVTYVDGYGRTISNASQDFPITLRARDRHLYIAIIIGVFVGALLKIYLQRLQTQGVISRREAVKAMAITIMIGLVVSVVALAGQIKVTAFEFTGSYDKPIVIFMIGLTGALIGAQLLTSWFKRLTKKEND